MQVWAIQYKSWPICKDYIIEIKGSDCFAVLVSFTLYALSLLMIEYISLNNGAVPGD